MSQNSGEELAEYFIMKWNHHKILLGRHRAKYLPPFNIAFCSMQWKKIHSTIRTYQITQLCKNKNTLLPDTKLFNTRDMQNATDTSHYFWCFGWVMNFNKRKERQTTRLYSFMKWPSSVFMNYCDDILFHRRDDGNDGPSLFFARVCNAPSVNGWHDMHPLQPSSSSSHENEGKNAGQGYIYGVWKYKYDRLWSKWVRGSVILLDFMVGVDPLLFSPYTHVKLAFLKIDLVFRIHCKLKIRQPDNV